MCFSCRYCLPDPGNVALNTGTQLQIAAQLPQLGGNAADFLRYLILSGPPQPVQVPAPFCEGVDLRLQGVVLHGQLLRRLNVIAVEKAELSLILLQLDKLPAHGKSRPWLRTALLKRAEKI